MPDRSRLIYWDSCVFLHYIEGTPEWLPVLDALMDEASTAGNLEIVTSTVSIVEVAYAKAEKAARLLDPAVVAAMDALWSDRSVVQLVEFDQVIARAARELLRKSAEIQRSLKPMDAIHLATAINVRVSDFHTTDDVLKNWKDLEFPVRDPWTSTPKLGI